MPPRSTTGLNRYPGKLILEYVGKPARINVIQIKREVARRFNHVKFCLNWKRYKVHTR